MDGDSEVEMDTQVDDGSFEITVETDLDGTASPSYQKRRNTWPGSLLTAKVLKASEVRHFCLYYSYAQQNTRIITASVLMFCYPMNNARFRDCMLDGLTQQCRLESFVRYPQSKMEEKMQAVSLHYFID